MEYSRIFQQIQFPSQKYSSLRKEFFENFRISKSNVMCAKSVKVQL